MKSNRNGWVTVDLDGLAKTIARNGKNFILSELLRNAWDEAGVTEVHITTVKIAGEPVVRIMIGDNSPNGFRNLADAYTLFADSYKKDNPQQAGRFNAGEKLVLALCESAIITTTTGTVHFSKDGTRQTTHRRADVGSSVDLFVRMNKSEHAELLEFARTLLVPRGIETTINGSYITPRKPIATLPARLTTEVAGEEGILRRVKRDTTVDVVEPNEGETPQLYELGIPVQEIDCKWHVNVQQKVPLTLERDAVRPSFLREINVLLVNELNNALSKDDAADSWVRDGVAHRDIKPEAVTHIMDLRFGEKRVAYDPSDEEANRTAASKGYTVVHGGSMSRDEWRNVRAAEAIKPAGQVEPTYKPYNNSGAPAEFVPEEEWTAGMRNISEYIHKLGWRVLGKSILVRYETGRAKDPFTANYGDRTFTWNFDKIGRRDFDTRRKNEWLNSVIIHELAHDFGSHLTEEFDDAMSAIGAKMVALAFTEPELFEDK